MIHLALVIVATIIVLEVGLAVIGGICCALAWTWDELSGAHREPVPDPDPDWEDPDWDLEDHTY